MIDPDEGRLLAVLCLSSVFFSAAVLINDGIAQTLLLKRIGIEMLPRMFVVKAVLDVSLALAYVPVARGFGHHRTMLAVLALGAAATAGARQVLPGTPVWSVVAFFAFSEVFQTLLKIHWGVYLLDHYRGAASRRLVPLVYAAARTGALLGGLALGRMTGRGNPLAMLGPAAVLFSVAAAVLWRHRPQPRDLPVDLSLVSSAEAKRHARHPLIGALAMATGAMVWCRSALRYRYSAIFAQRLSEARLTRYYGLYCAAANPLVVLLQLAVVSRLLLHGGVVVVNALYSVMLLLATALVLGDPNLVSATCARVVEHELKLAIKSPLSNLFYQALPPDQRPRGRALVLGVTGPLATAACGIALHAPQLMRVWALPAALLFVAATLWQNRVYRTTDRTIFR